jgi:hypothetical protein
MTHQAVNLFDSIESAQDFLTLLSDTVRDIRADVDSDIAANSQAARKTMALRLVAYDLAKLELRLRTGHQILDHFAVAASGGVARGCSNVHARPTACTYAVTRDLTFLNR